MATDSRDSKATVENYTIEVKHKDTDKIEFGPNHRGCGHGTPQRDDDPFDGRFKCDCNSTTYEGDNCDIKSATPAPVDGTDNGSEVEQVAAGLLTSFVLMLGFGFAIFRYRLKQIAMRAIDLQGRLEDFVASGIIDGSMISEDGTVANAKIPREINRSTITMIQRVGSGQFGEVWKSVLDESKVGGVPGYSVAVKTALEATGEGADEMTREALVMAQLGYHVNVVSIIGVVTSGLPLFLVLSFCENGSVKSALQAGEVPGQRRPKDVPSHKVARQMAIEIARGMMHLVQHRFVHRDLAARNILLDSQHVCKIADFGLSRGVHTSSSNSSDDEEESEYYTSQRGTFPVRWTAPEAMESMKFSMSTDVWSYGVVLLEIGLGGEMPYPELATNNVVINTIMRGYMMPKPTGCSDEVYNLYTKCCSLEPSDRPSFSDIDAMLSYDAHGDSEAGSGSDPKAASNQAASNLGRNGQAGENVLVGPAADSTNTTPAETNGEDGTYAVRGRVSDDGDPNLYAQTMTQQFETATRLTHQVQRKPPAETNDEDGTYAARGRVSGTVVGVPVAIAQETVVETSFGSDTYAARGVISENVVGVSPAGAHVRAPDSTLAEDDGPNLYAQTMTSQFDTATRLPHEAQPPANDAGETSGCMDVVGANSAGGSLIVENLDSVAAAAQDDESLDNESSVQSDAAVTATNAATRRGNAGNPFSKLISPNMLAVVALLVSVAAFTEPETFFGTWDENEREAERFNGQRVVLDGAVYGMPYSINDPANFSGRDPLTQDKYSVRRGARLSIYNPRTGVKTYSSPIPKAWLPGNLDEVRKHHEGRGYRDFDKGCLQSVTEDFLQGSAKSFSSFGPTAVAYNHKIYFRLIYPKIMCDTGLSQKSVMSFDVTVRCELMIDRNRIFDEYGNPQNNFIGQSPQQLPQLCNRPNTRLEKFGPQNNTLPSCFENTIIIYSPASDTFSRTNATITESSDTIAGVVDGKIYWMGDSQWVIYNTKTDEVSYSATMPNAGLGFENSTGVVVGGKIYTFMSGSVISSQQITTRTIANSTPWEVTGLEGKLPLSLFIKKK